jgi:hypothetical protein
VKTGTTDEDGAVRSERRSWPAYEVRCRARANEILHLRRIQCEIASIQQSGMYIHRAGGRAAITEPLAPVVRPAMA